LLIGNEKGQEEEKGSNVEAVMMYVAPVEGLHALPFLLAHICACTRLPDKRLGQGIRLHILHFVCRKSIGLLYLIVGMREAQMPIHIDKSQIKVSLFPLSRQHASTHCMHYSTCKGASWDLAKNGKADTFVVSVKEQGMSGCIILMSFIPRNQ
jgi:hypothetical protein